MPTTFQSLEQSLPRADDRRALPEKVDGVYQYLYQLMELLRYTLDNLGVDNFNDKELTDLSATISAPIYKRIEDAEGNINEISATADQVSARLTNAEGNISSLTLTAEMNSSRLTDAEGHISTLTQTSQSLSSRISDAEGNISNLTQTANSLTSRISSTEGDVSSLSQTVGSFSSRISSVEGDVSSISQTVDSITLSVTSGTSGTTVALLKDGVVVSSGDIVIAGYVTFTDLSTSGNTTINGDNITTGTLNVDLIKPNNGVYVSFSHPVAASSFNSHYFTLAENAEICLGSQSTASSIASNYPNAIVLEGTTILHSSAYAYTYKNGSYGFYEVITAANIEDYLADVEVTARFG